MGRVKTLPPFYHIPVHATIVSRVEPTAQIYSEVANMPTLTVADQVTINAYLEECLKNQTPVNVSNIIRLLNRSEGSRSRLNDYIANWMPLETTLVMPEVRHDIIDVFPIGQMPKPLSDVDITTQQLKNDLSTVIDSRAYHLEEAAKDERMIDILQEVIMYSQNRQT